MAESADQINKLLEQVRTADDSQLVQSLKTFLQGGDFGSVATLTNLERHRFVTELFNRLDTAVQERMRKAVATLLETFEASNPKDNSEYLFYLISLTSVIRSPEAKERLRRWVRLGTFDGWQHDIFDLNSELILATSSYDADDDWVDFILNVLSKRSSFKDSALAAYRAIWQMRGVECISLLPQIFVIADLEDAAFSKSLGYLLRLTIDKAGAEQFCKTAIAALDRMEKAVHEIWTIILRIEEIIDRELLIYGGELHSLTKHLGEVWDKGIDKWNSSPQLEAYEAFDKLLEVPEKDWEHIRITPPGIKAAFKFRQKYVIEISEHHTYILEHCDRFFHEINYEKEGPKYMTAGGQGAAM